MASTAYFIHGLKTIRVVLRMRQVTIKFDEGIASSNHVEPDGLVLVFSVLPALCRGGCVDYPI